MSATASDLRPASEASSWRTPLVIIACGCLIALLSFGPRSSMGFFIQPMSRDLSWGRDVFGLALAVQNLLWGLGQPFAGRDRRSLRHLARDVRRRAALCSRLADDALRHDAAVARARRGRTDRLRPVRLLVQPRAVGFLKAVAPGEARPGARRGHGGRLVRPVHLRADRRRAARHDRLARHVDGVCSADAPDRAAVAGAGHAARGCVNRAGGGPAILQDCAHRGLRPSLLCAAGARLLHLRLPACLHHRAFAGLSGRPRHHVRRPAAG